MPTTTSPDPVLLAAAAAEPDPLRFVQLANVLVATGAGAATSVSRAELLDACRQALAGAAALTPAAAARQIAFASPASDEQVRPAANAPTP